MVLIPYQADVPMRRWPVANFAIISVTVIVFALQNVSTGENLGFERLVLDGWSPVSMVGCVLLHADLVHLIGNMLFLWVFGNAICAKVGNIAYVGIYAGLAVLASASHNLLDGGPAVGASGAINGVVGMFLIWYPLNEISCVWYFGYRSGEFECSSYWLILLWLGFDVWGAATGDAGIGYMAHIGGLAGGASIATLLLATRWVEMEPTERSIFDVIRGDEPRAATEPLQKLDTVVTSQPQLDRVYRACQCGQMVGAHSNLAGRSVRCPRCGRGVRLPVS